MNIKKFVGEGETEKAIEALMSVATKSNNRELENQAINLSSQLSSLKKDEKLFMITKSKASALRTRINVALLAIADDIKEEALENTAVENDGARETEADGALTKEKIEALEQQQILDRIQKIMKRRKFFQDQFDIASDASQKFNLQQNIDLMDSDLDLLKATLG